MSTEPAPAPRRWDPIVKLTHWGIVVAIIANALFTEEGSGWHVWVGYGLAALLALRLLWGFVGPAEARFSAFPPSPRRAMSHMGEIRRGEVIDHRSHNPLGALMVYAIWICLAVIITTGIAMSGPPPANPNAKGEHGDRQEQVATMQTGLATYSEKEEDEAPDRMEARGDDPEGSDEDGHDGDEEGPFAEAHEIAVNLLYLLIALHLAGVVFETRRSGPHIARAMIPGGTRKS